MSQLEAIGKQLKARRDEQISKAAHDAAMEILLEAEAKGSFDPRDIADRISEAVGKILTNSSS